MNQLNSMLIEGKIDGVVYYAQESQEAYFYLNSTSQEKHSYGLYETISTRIKIRAKGALGTSCSSLTSERSVRVVGSLRQGNLEHYIQAEAIEYVGGSK